MWLLMSPIWVGGVQSIEDVGVACTGDDAPVDWRESADYIVSLFPGPAESRWQGTIHVRPIRPNTWLRSLLLTLDSGEQRTYVVPQGDTFLLGPNGDTIDRI